jgi:cytochrome subunit of sulfide dehydrogenase
MSCLTPRITTFVLVCGVLTFQAATAADDMTINRLLASQCSQCHGTNGRSVGDIDSLAGEDDISDELNEMRNKSNPDDIMEHQAMGYTSDQIRRIAAYYATASENGGSNTGDSGGTDSGGSGGSDSGNSDDSHKDKKSKHRKKSRDRDRDRDRDREKSKHREKSKKRDKSERRRSRDSD